MRNTLKAFKCSNCTDETGMMAHTLVQVLREPHEANGKLVAGSLWWACARCLTAYYRIRTFIRRR